MIEAKGLRLRFGDKEVIQDLSFSLPAEGVFAIRGNSGTGKTTLLRLLAGLIPPSAGSVTGLSDTRIGVVFQQDRLLPWRTAIENVAEVSDGERAAALLAKLGLSDAMDLYPRELSGGMARRVAIARAMAYSDEALFLDEPFTGLDETAKEAAAALLKEAARLIVMVSHDEEDLLLMGAEPLVEL